MQVAEGAGFQECELLVEMPHASRACKMFLCASKCHERAPPPERTPPLEDAKCAPRARRRVCVSVCVRERYNEGESSVADAPSSSA
jgi:hypothetical protein